MFVLPQKENARVRRGEYESEVVHADLVVIDDVVLMRQRNELERHLAHRTARKELLSFYYLPALAAASASVFHAFHFNTRVDELFG